MPKELTPTFTVISKACDGDETAISKSWNFMTHISIRAVCVRFTTITTTYVLR